MRPVLAVVADIVTLLIPLYVLGFLLVLLLALTLLGRYKGGRYLRPVVAQMTKVPLLKRGLEKMSTAALERSNPELASAMQKMQRAGATRDPQKAQAALSRLTAQERRAWMDAAEEQGVMPEPMNREQRRRLERARREQQRRGGR